MSVLVETFLVFLILQNLRSDNAYLRHAKNSLTISTDLLFLWNKKQFHNSRLTVNDIIILRLAISYFILHISYFRPHTHFKLLYKSIYCFTLLSQLKSNCIICFLIDCIFSSSLYNSTARQIACVISPTIAW